jgi:HEPN domain-containing protein
MAQQKTSKMWLDRVAYDIDTAKAMLQTGRLIYAIFMCQQSLKKCFKALLAYKNKEIIPIHNLRHLAEVGEVIHELDEPTLVKLDFLSSYYVNARYKEDLQQLSRGITESVAQDFIQFSEGSLHGFAKRSSDKNCERIS